MQLHLEIDELNLLANVFMERISTTSTQPSSGNRLNSEARTQPDTRQLNDLLDKVLARDLRFDCDELEQVVSLLDREKRELASDIAGPANAGSRDELQRKLKLLERVMEKVDEACAMV